MNLVVLVFEIKNTIIKSLTMAIYFSDNNQ